MDDKLSAFVKDCPKCEGNVYHYPEVPRPSLDPQYNIYHDKIRCAGCDYRDIILVVEKK